MESKTINNHNIYYHRLQHNCEGLITIEQLERNYLINQNWIKFIKPGSNTIDIGAHSGDTLIPLIIAGTNNFQSKTKILAFEPNHNVFNTCEKNVLSNISNYVDIKLLPYAIIDEDNKDVLFSDHGNDMCNGGIIHDNMDENLKHMLENTPNRKSFNCKGYTLNTLCNNYLTQEEIKNISFIKIDTEGYDREIVISSKDFLMKYKPVVFMEWFNFYGEEDSNKLFKVIEEINYVPFNPVTLEVASVKNKIWDLLLIHKEDIENLNKTKKFYSQCQEDKYLNECIFKNMENGIYIELGALDGTLYSNTKFFEDSLNWKGILIEPHPEKFKSLKINRPNNLLFNDLVSCNGETLKYRYFIDGFSAVSGIENTLPDKHFIDYFDNNLIVNNNEQNIIEIKSKTLTEIVRNSNYKHIDLLSLDVEGHEYEVLLSWDFSIPIYIILVEMLDSNDKKNKLCRDILIKNNYILIKKYYHNEIFALNTYIENNTHLKLL